jgi:putative endonuclease
VVDVAADLSYGVLGERIAADYLALRDCRIIGRNVRSGHLEIDLIIEDRSCIAFVEVKTRRGKSFGEALEAVSRWKMLNMRKAAGRILPRLNLHGAYDEIRFDLVAIDLDPTRDVMTLRHIKGIS